MEGLKLTIPQRLFLVRATVTLGLIISFFLSLNLWGGQRYFPSQPLFEEFFLKAPYDYILMGCSVIFLLCSLIFYQTRTFLLLAILVNCFLVMFDLNRLQIWFYVYNAILFIHLFYNGRIDNPEKYTSIFIFIQIVICSVYVYNGISHLKNPYFLSTDYAEIISPLRVFLSERQFLFFLKAGHVVPYIFILCGILFLFPSAKYLAVSTMLLIHTILFLLLFPGFSNNYALWFMNLIFGASVFILFSGNTRQRYFSWTVLLKKPLFYIIVFFFSVLPSSPSIVLPASLCFNFKSGKLPGELQYLSEAEYQVLPYYTRAFCKKTTNGYYLDRGHWFRNELKSEYIYTEPEITIAKADNDENSSIKELSSLD
jgi:hypothetical protein